MLTPLLGRGLCRAPALARALLDLDQVAHLVHPASVGAVVFDLYRLAPADQAERLHGQLLVLFLADGALLQCYLQARHHSLLPTAASRRRRSAVGSFMAARPLIVAWTTFMMLLLPSDFASTSLTPAISMTARTPPPAMRPVPGEAGLISTRAALNLTNRACGRVDPFIGTLIRFLRAM